MPASARPEPTGVDAHGRDLPALPDPRPPRRSPTAHTEFKCCPPIRDAANRDALWDGLAAGDIDLVVSDHSPCTADLKRFETGDFGEAWGGIAWLQLGSAGGLDRGASCAATPWPTWRGGWPTAPADLVGLRPRAGSRSGAVADLCAFAPDEAFTVDAARLHHKNPVSPYAGRTLTGTVRRTWLRGVPVDLDAPRADGC